MDEIKRFGELVPGDIIEGADGRPTRVVAAYDEHTPEVMYEITTDEGETIKASGNHLWYVETTLDYSLHRERRRVGRKHFGKLPAAAAKLLLQTAESPDEVETALIDMVFLLEAQDSVEATRSIERVAEAIGHVAENTNALQDMETGEVIEKAMVRTYDARIFAQQLLSLSGARRWRRRWPLIAGRVMTTEQLVHEPFDAELPVAHPLSS
jgi:hypothetical protein